MKMNLDPVYTVHWVQTATQGVLKGARAECSTDYRDLPLAAAALRKWTQAERTGLAYPDGSRYQVSHVWVCAHGWREVKL
jgi:hypothetical protein